ncbi:OsmC family protein [Balneola sp. MJW-20]|uniref:OsmC family protein n=1 Tax=Gracilimonas aurantiaca TaxID=3234185 RepID=UPI0038B416DE
MINKEHKYHTIIEWTGNKGAGTSGYHAYGRDHQVSVYGKETIRASSDPAYLGDPTLYNPEELFVISVSSCHMLWYLHLCSDSNIIVENYQDKAVGILKEDGERGGKFTSIVLKPKILVRNGSDLALAMELHDKAHEKCFIANSCKVVITIEAEIREAD